jgi:hypothetical protein
MTDYTDILICAAAFKVGSEMPRDVIEEIETKAADFIEGGEIALKPFHRYQYMWFMEKLVAVRDILKSHKISFAPKIIAVLYTARGETTGAYIKTTAKEVNVVTGNIKVSFAKQDKPAKSKTLTVEEKLGLVQQWKVSHPGTIPAPNEKFNNFAIGKFYAKACTDADLKVKLDEILNE